MQANGAEMLRLACCYAVERGIRVCAPVHDAILIEAPLDSLDEAISTAQQAMADASAAVLAGFRLSSEAKIIRYPDRYMDAAGQKMWATVWSILKRLGIGDLCITCAPAHTLPVRRCNITCASGAHPYSLIYMSY